MTPRITANPLRPRSAAEVLLEEQLRQAGISFEAEYKFAASMGRRWRADFVIYGRPAWVGTDENGRWVPNRLLIEVDGGAFVSGRHVTGTGFEKDAEKLNAAAELGYRVLRYTPRMVNNGSALEQIGRILSKLEETYGAAA